MGADDAAPKGQAFRGAGNCATSHNAPAPDNEPTFPSQTRHTEPPLK